MHSKRSLAGAYLVNGAPSWLQVEPEGLSWWPATAMGADQPRAESIGILCSKQRVEFDQVIGIKQKVSKLKSRTKPGDFVAPGQLIHGLDSGSGSSLSQSSQSTSRSTVNELPMATAPKTTSNSSLEPNFLGGILRQDFKWSQDGQRLFQVNKIKVYYAKRSETKTTGRLLKVKKLTIQSIRSNGRGRRTQLGASERLAGGVEIDIDESNSIANNQPSVRLESRIVVAESADTKATHDNNNNNNNNRPARMTTSQSCQFGPDCDKSDTSLTPPTTTATNETSLGVRGASSRYSAASSTGGTSAPPSCYASEGSWSRLSSCSSSRDSPSPIEQQQQQQLGSVGADEARLMGNLSICDTKASEQQLPRLCLIRLYEQLERQLKIKQRQRPKRLLIFVNPFGGKGKALQLYKRRVRCLLELAGIEAKLIVTQYANHARDTIEDLLFNVDYFDGIICVGGDGMFSELMNGLLFRYNRDKILSSKLNNLSRRLSGCLDGDELIGGDQAAPLTPTNNMGNQPARSGAGNHVMDHEQQAVMNDDRERKRRHLNSLRGRLGGLGERFKTPSIPVGVIGAGSTDCNSFGLIGTNDAITATLNIILGKQIYVDVCSVHSIRDDDRLLRFVSTFIAYGYFGDVIRESEKLRWLGPSRYDVTGLNTLLRNRAYNGLVRIICSPSDGSPNELGNKCHLNCSVCKQEQLEETQDQDQQQMDSLGCDVDENGLDENEQHTNGQTNAGGEHDDDDDQLELIEHRGPFVGVNAAVMACRCPQTKKGFSPSNHLANGCADLILVRPCTRLQYINYLIRTGYSKKSAFDLKYVDAYRCRQFEFLAQDELHHHLVGCNSEPSGSLSSSSRGSNSLSSQQSSKSNSLEATGVPREQTTRRTRATATTTTTSCDELAQGSSWNADGEILTEQSIRVKVNNRLLRVFGTGEPQPS